MRAALAAIGIVFLGSTVAAASHNTAEVVSTGPSGGNGALSSQFRGASADGNRVFFQTSEQLVPADTDSRMDVYERAAGVTTLVSTGPAGGNGAFNASFAAASANGTRVFFRTSEQLVGADSDAVQDLYERAGGTTTLISTGPAGGNGAYPVIFGGISSDGSHVFFDTGEALVAADTDAARDVYRRSAGATALMSPGTGDPELEGDAVFQHSSADGARVLFHTEEPIAPSDLDTMQDVYETADGVTTHLSIGPVGGNGNLDFDYDAFFDGASADGSKVWLHTDEVLVAEDTDAANDVYEREGAALRLVSGGSADTSAFWVGASEDGARVFFDTTEPLVAQDTDSSTDVYERSGGSTTLLSTGPAGGNGAAFAAFQGASADGTRVFFHTPEALVAEDTDSMQDVYERAGGSTALVSRGPGSSGGAFPAAFKGASRDGTRVFFDTSEDLAGVGTGTYPDLYERTAGTTTIVSVGPADGHGDFFVFFGGASDDGTRVFAETSEALVATDTDSSQDVYAFSIATGAYPRPLSAGPVRVSLVPAYEACSAPNREHGPPLASPSCNPPALVSPHLTLGAADSTGSVKLQPLIGNPATPGDQADVRIVASLSDVRLKADGSDYTGELALALELRITDRLNGVAPVFNGTAVDLPFPVTVPCAATAAASTGARCTVNTTADAVLPGAVAEQKRAIWQVAAVRVDDGGADGVAATPGNSRFATQGIFIP